MLLSPENRGPRVIFLLFIPILYIILGFIGGVIGAFVYNLCAKWVGGIELEFEEEKEPPISNE
ncbi:MAG: DUF3566 domain-containing protein [Candidatus Omnitrophota bacterium]